MESKLLVVNVAGTDFLVEPAQLSKVMDVFVGCKMLSYGYYEGSYRGETYRHVDTIAIQVKPLQDDVISLADHLEIQKKARIAQEKKEAEERA